MVQLLKLVWGVFPQLETDAVLDLNHYEMSYQLIQRYLDGSILDLEDRIIITSGSNLMTKMVTKPPEIDAV